MIACKARFTILSHAWITPLARNGAIALCFVGLFVVPLHAQDYLYNRLYEFDRDPIDYSARHLSDNVRFLLYHSIFKVRQTGYANNSGNLANLQIGTDFLQMARAADLGLVPEHIDRDLYNAERFTVRLYESLARRWERLNPIPGLHYDVIVRSSAYPFIFMEALDLFYSDLGTFPFTDDQKFRMTQVGERQFALAFRIAFG